MFDLDRILADPTLPPVIVPGNHGALAERYRDRALSEIARARIFLEMLDYCLRERPDEDAKFDESAVDLMAAIRGAGVEVGIFRATRPMARRIAAILAPQSFQVIDSEDHAEMLCCREWSEETDEVLEQLAGEAETELQSRTRQ